MHYLSVFEVNLAIFIVIMIKIMYLIGNSLYIAFNIICILPILITNKHIWLLKTYESYIGNKIELYLHDNSIINCRLRYVTAIISYNIKVIMIVVINNDKEVLYCDSEVSKIIMRDMKQYMICLNEILLRKNMPFEIGSNIIKYL
jgi:hypothetical protein